MMQPGIFVEPGTVRLYHIIRRNAMIYRTKGANDAAGYLYGAGHCPVIPYYQKKCNDFRNEKRWLYLKISG